MLFRPHIPAPPLSDFIELLWLYEGWVQPHRQERVLPQGAMELVIDLRDRKSAEPAVLAGAWSEFFVIETGEPQTLLGVHFRPGGAFPFLGLPAGEVHNQMVLLDDLWGATAASVLRERLLATATADEKFAILEQALLTIARGNFERSPAIACALRELTNVPQQRSIAEVAEGLGMSQRRFIELFRAEVGLTPKLFCRVRRFSEAIRVIGQRRQVSLSDVAYVCGYFDQAHFIHDFQSFAGMSPRAYLMHCREHLHHVPVLD